MERPARYLLVTPVRDEIGLLDDLVATVRAQEQLPERWVIVDDGSRDGTAEELARLAAREPWIHVVALASGRSGPTGRPSGTRHAEVVTIGLRVAAELVEADRLDVEFVANVDADVRCPPHLLVELVARVAQDRTVGFASCRLIEVKDDGSTVEQPEPVCGTPRGSLRMWRRECAEEIGLSVLPNWAGVTGVRARNRGWKTVVYADLVAETVRPDGTRHGWWHGYRRDGRASWDVGLHPALLLGQAVTASMRERDLRGIALVSGYVEGALSGRRRVLDAEVRDFFGDDLPRRAIGGRLGNRIGNRIGKWMRLVRRPPPESEP
jgi:poly-beta-1,6-N-acetyl-D-glucosamine synthase